MERKFSEIPRECEEITIDTDNITNYRKFTEISYYFSIYIYYLYRLSTIYINLYKLTNEETRVITFLEK